MKRSVATQLDQLKNKLNGYVALLVYRYANLCIEANPIALLPVKVMIENEEKNMEDVAKIAVFETYHFAVIPIYDDDLFAIGQAIMKEHPEFKQELKTLDGHSEDDPEGKFLFYTMPEVNKERHELLLQLVDALYDECKEKMEVAQQTCNVKLAILQADASTEEQEKTAEIIKDIMKQFEDMRDTNRDGKKQEVEDAYEEWQKKQAEKEANKEEKQQEQGNPLQMVMDAAGV